MSLLLESYAAGSWYAAPDEGAPLLDAATGDLVARVSSTGLDVGAMRTYAREVAGPQLREMTFRERAAALKAVAKLLQASIPEFTDLSYATGATKTDSEVDVDGGAATTYVMASTGARELPDSRIHLDGGVERLSRHGTFVGQHVHTPMRGVAVQINAYNFPVWGMLEKFAPAFLAGVPSIVKPASQTSYLTHLVARTIIDSGLIPDGALQLICGGVGDLLDRLDSQDLVLFTGSAWTARKLRGTSNLLDHGVRFNAEADSLNAAVLGPDAGPGTTEFDLYVAEVVKEMTTKAGQRCTAIRRVLVPQQHTEAVTEAIASGLADVVLGDPRNASVTMGALVGMDQREEVRDAVRRLVAAGSLRVGSLEGFAVAEGDADRGAFLPPLLVTCDDADRAEPHDIEAFGPVSTVIGYRDRAHATELLRRGRGSLVASVFTADTGFASEVVHDAAAFHGRIHIVDAHAAKEQTGHGTPMPQMVHGGPGRAGGGEELGGMRSVLHFMQRTAVQGSPGMLTAIGERWVPGAAMPVGDVHPFRRHFDEIAIGDSFVSDDREVTLAEIEAFAALTGDTFYAHMDEAAAAANPFFEGRVAHGYLLVSLAAGLFVDPDPGPVLANYGIDDLRFLTPVNPGDRIRVSLTCAQRTGRPDKDYGEVRWATRISNQDGETCALYDVLTMVAWRHPPASAT